MQSKKNGAGMIPPVNKTPPQVSVIIPAYNQAEYLGEAIQSVLNQTFINYEIIVVDDGSTDNTPNIARQFGSAIRYIQQSNQGLSAARNTAIRHSQAEIIAPLDSDDFWEPEFLEKMLNHLNCHPQAAAVYCGYRYIDSEGKIVGIPMLKVVPPELFNKTLICQGNWLVPCAVVFRKRLAKDVGLFDETIGPVADTDLWFKLSDRYPFEGLPEVLAKYRRHDSNMTKDPKKMIDAAYLSIEKHYGPPDGDVSSWGTSKRAIYSRHFFSGARDYLSYGDIEESVYYFQRLLDISSSTALSMGVWRAFARAHMPVEYRQDPSTSLDWVLAERDINGFLRQLCKDANTLVKRRRYFSRIKGSAFLALAEEAVRVMEIRRAYIWLLRASYNCPKLLLHRSFWGTVARSVSRLKKQSMIAKKRFERS